MQKRKIIATAGLPYANGPIHIGHLVEYLQVDFWSRFQKMRGHKCLYLCGDDTHGTPVMVKARELKITPEEHIAQSYREHLQDFTDFQVEFDLYSSTNTKENRELCEEIFGHMQNKKHIDVRAIEQLYCNHDKMFLPDRFVKGTCPNCKSANQYGDSCDSCGTTYQPTDLLSPHCSICGTTPVLQKSDHVFFKLNNFKKDLQDWTRAHTSSEVANKLQEWLKEDLRDWDISRDDPYFGFAIPGFKGKYFYVWVDAPMGYVSATRIWCEKHKENFHDYWKNDSAEIYHFIGKDIMYFHTLFWPALLKAADYRTPDQVFVHGFLTVNGEKMSKSKGTFIRARTYLNHLDPSYLRYYYACKIASGMDDLDLNFDDFVQRVNSDLIGKITNLASRGGQMLTKKMDGVLSPLSPASKEWLKKAQAKGESIAQHYENRDFGKALSEIRALADEGNRFFDEKAPWKTLESDPKATQEVLSTTLNLFRLIAIYLKPILPVYAKKVEMFFKESNYTWQSHEILLENHKLADYEHLAVRIEVEKVKNMVEQEKAEGAKTIAPAPTAAPENSVLSIDDFMKVDLRVVKIIEAEEVVGTDKMLKLKVDLGSSQKTIFAGIKTAYQPKDLIGRMTVIVANLAPRKMKFGVSEGMVLAAGPGGKDLFILSPDSGANPGDKVK